MVKLQYPDLEPYAMDGYLYENLKDVRDIVENEKQSFILVNDGRTGLGKTTLSFQQAFFFARGNKEKFNLDHVLYDPEPSFDLVSNSKNGDVWVFDESIIFNSRSAMTQFNKTMLMLLSTIRSKQIYIILNIPSFFNLDSGITLDKVNLLIHLYGDHLGDRGKFMAFDEDRMKNLYIYGRKGYNYNVAKANFFASFSSKFLLDEKSYDDKKTEAVKKMISSQGTPVTRTLVQRDFLLAYLNQNVGTTYREITDILPDGYKLTHSTISTALGRIRNKFNPEWFKKREIEY